MSEAQALAHRAPRILVADDDEGVRAGLVANLELEGYVVSQAGDGAAAMELIASQRYELILSDVVMPSATGIDLLSALRRQHLDTPFILISAYVSEELVSRALGDGLFAMLYKPFSMDRILEVVARALRRNVVLLLEPAQSEPSSLTAALRSAGVRAEGCADGASALAFATENVVDVCVLDLVEQPSEGLRTAAELQRINDRMDIIAITKGGSAEPVKDLARRGVVSVLRKPFDARDLLTAIARVRAATPVRK